MNTAPTLYQCPVCAFAQMDESPRDHAICACCGTQFGYDDFAKTFRMLRDEWLRAGGKWFDTEDSAFPCYGLGWNPWLQLDRAGFAYTGSSPAPRATSLRLNYFEELCPAC